MAPNVLLVVLDAARRDALEPYGASAGSTPTIAQLARSGHAFPYAYSTSSWTLPSHASMFTGMLPRQLGLALPPAQTPQSARPVLESVAERMLGPVLRKAGYATHGLTTNVWASAVAGFDVGFDSFRYICSGREERIHELLGQGRRAQLEWAREGVRSGWDDGAADAGVALRRSIEEWAGTPTFWFVNLGECHSPYLPPRPWNDLAPWNRARAALEAQRHLNFESICLYIGCAHEISPDALARMRHLYGRSVSYMDDWLAGILDALDARGILDETLIIVTSDHGENFGEGGLIAHGFSVDERLIHVPLVVAGPGAEPVERVFSQVELPRLIARAAGLEQHPWDLDELPAGVAIAQYDPMAVRESTQARAFSEKWSLGEEGIDRLTARFTSVTDGRTKLVVRNDRELLYDLLTDPGENDPLDPSGTNGPVQVLRDALENRAVAEAATAPASAAGPSTASAEEIAELERRMQLLGYM